MVTQERSARWLRRIHPSILAASLGIFGASLVFDFGSSRAKEQFVYARGAYTLIGVGLLVGLVGVVFWVLELAGWPRGGRSRREGIGALLVFDVLLLWFAFSFVRRNPLGAIQGGAIVLMSAVLVAVGVISHVRYLRVLDQVDLGADDQADVSSAGSTGSS